MTEILSKLARYFKIATLIFAQTLQRNIISVKRSSFFSPETQPDAWKAIACKTYLYDSRIFKPKPQNASSPVQPLPLVIMVHGGGFIMNNPSIDDPLARFLADQCNCIVVSIDYRKAPIHRFPAAYEDVVESILAVLSDGGIDHPIDSKRVILCGSSAGGNLVLTAAQDIRIREKLSGVVSIYPVVDMVPTAKQQMATRPDPNIPDFLEDKLDDVKEIYVGTTDAATLRDPRISPTNFKQRDDLPENILIIGCEHDLLCHDAKVMADKLMGATTSQKDKAEGVSWRLVKGQTHGFDHFPTRTPEQEETRTRDRDTMYQGIAQWLKGVFEAV